MSADQDYTGFRCFCPHCMALQDDGASGSRYTIPNGPTIPSGPTIPTGPSIPSGPTIPPSPPIPDPTTPTSPTTPDGTDGYTGPRYHTLLWPEMGDWNGAEVGTPVLVPYSFATRSLSRYAVAGTGAQTGFDLTASEALDTNQRASIRQALDLWEEVSGLTFIEVPDPAELNLNGIRFSMEDLDIRLGIEGVLGYAMPNSTWVHGFNIQFNQVHYADDLLLKGTDPFATAMHEIGHAVGLKHPFHGSPNLSTEEDNTSNTVMSYTDGGNYSHLGWIDIEAVRHIYGTPEAEAAAPVRWSRGPGGALVTTGNDAANAIAGLVIRDVVHANAGDDLIETHGGDDEITAGAGNDAVFGGAGLDTLVTGALRLQAQVALGAGRGTVALPDGTDTFYDVEVLRFLDGDLVLGAGGAAGQVYRLYGAVLGREPDAVGLGHWASALQSGAISASGAAAALTGSAEFAGSHAAQNNAGFVATLYQNVLGRAPDAAGLDFWMNAMAAGAGRAAVVLGFSDSPEHRQKTDGAFAGGLWIADPEAVDVVRAYAAVLDRLPDAGGLASWTVARDAGLGQADLIGTFVDSDEFQARFGGLSNRDFVEQLYRASLDRAADAGGLAAWTHVLDAGLGTRTGVALGFAGSAEMTAKITPLVEDGILFA